MTDIFCLGELLIDFIPGNEPASYVRKAGGAPANVAIAASKNGLQAAMATKVGNDDFGHFLVDTLKEFNVEMPNEPYTDEAVTTMAFVTLQDNGERTFTFARKPGADALLSAEEITDASIENSVIVHAGSFSLSMGPAAEATVKFLKRSHELGKLVSFDVNYRNVPWHDDVEACTKAVMEILPYVDMLKISDEEVEMMGGVDNIPKLMKEMGLTMVIETLGSDGAQAFFNDQIIKVPGRKVKAVDATGAGDAFWGGFLSSLRINGVEKASDLNEEVIRKSMDYGNVSGCICVQSKGAIPSIPTREMIEDFLSKN